jgi:predicted nucleic acid-binding protein
VPVTPLVYLDTNVFIHGIEGNDLEGNDLEASPIQTLFRGLRDFPNASVTSELTLAELLAPATRPDALHLNHKEQLYLDLVIGGGFVVLYPVTRDVLISTGHLRLNHSLKLPDAIHVVTAFATGCRYFMSYDKDGKKLPFGLCHIRPDDKGVATVLDALRV